jgi:hypothetical protein
MCRTLWHSLRLQANRFTALISSIIVTMLLHYSGLSEVKGDAWIFRTYLKI